MIKRLILDIGSVVVANIYTTAHHCVDNLIYVKRNSLLLFFKKITLCKTLVTIRYMNEIFLQCKI